MDNPEGNRLVASMRPAEPSVSFVAAGASVAEDDEDFTLTLTAGQGFSVGPTGTHKVTILDDDPFAKSFRSLP